MKTPGDSSRQGGESPDEKKSVAIQKRKVRQKSHKINQICMKYHQLTLVQRNTIFVLLRKKMQVKNIAETINVHYSIVCHELKRNRERHHIPLRRCPKAV